MEEWSGTWTQVMRRTLLWRTTFLWILSTQDGGVSRSRSFLTSSCLSLLFLLYPFVVLLLLRFLLPLPPIIRFLLLLPPILCFLLLLRVLLLLLCGSGASIIPIDIRRLGYLTFASWYKQLVFVF